MRAHFRWTAWIAGLLLSLSALCVTPQTVLAQSSLEEAFELSKSAMEDYDFLELESADAKIMQAAQIVENLGMADKNAANVYVAQGIVSYGRFKDSAPAIADERAFSAFLKALTLNENAAIPKDYRTTELEAIMARAREAIATTPKTTIATIAGVKPVIEHAPSSAHPRCAPLEISATVPQHPDVYRVTLHYAQDEQPGFDAVEMKPDSDAPDTLRAIIPGLNTQGDRVRYYIEATDRAGKSLTNAGSESQPITTVLTGNCVGLSHDEIVAQYGDPLFQLSVMLGTGLGIVEGETYTIPTTLNGSTVTSASAYSGVDTGVATMPLHLRASAVFNLPANFQLGAYVRGQLINIVGKGRKLPKDTGNISMIDDGEVVGNLMVGATVRYLAIASQPYRLYVGLEFGWGGANATIFTGSKFNDFKAIYLIKGPFHIAPEIGFLWSFHKYVGLAIELAIPFHFPDKFNVHFDLSVGPYFQF